MKNIAVFASGGGSNAQKIIDFFRTSSSVRVALVVSNKPDAKVLSIAHNNNIPTLVINRKDFYDSEQILHSLSLYDIDLIVLAGFLWLIPSYLVDAFEQKIINIHPALLPKYGGKGMYGMNVHEAVALAKEKESGMTIHFVNSHYDEGNVIFQAKCDLTEDDDAQSISQKVLALEHLYFAPVINKILVE
jgi:phosphoribosylglycinamide formyltransferase 1